MKDESLKPVSHARLSAIFCSIALAALTLGTFGILREVGPESTLRKFHRAAVNGEMALAYSLSIHSSQEAVSDLSAGINQIARIGGQFLIEGSERKGDKFMLVQTVYIFPNGVSRARVWVLERENRQSPWKINATQTLLAPSQPAIKLN